MQKNNKIQPTRQRQSDEFLFPLSEQERTLMAKRPLRRLRLYTETGNLMWLRYIGAFIQAGAEIGFAMQLMRTVDSMIAGAFQIFHATFFFFLLFIVLMGLSTGSNSWLSGKISAQSAGVLRTALTQHFMDIPYVHVAGETATSAQTLITTVLRPVTDYFGRDLPAMVLMTSKFVMATIFLGFLNWELMLSVNLFIILFVWLSGKTGGPLQKQMQDLVAEQERVNAFIKETQSGLAIIKAYSLSSERINQFHAVQKTFYGQAKKVERSKAGLQFYELFLNYAPFIACFVLGGLFAVQGAISAGAILALVQLVGCIAEPAAMTPVLLGRAKIANGAAEKMIQFFRIEREAAADSEQREPACGQKNISGTNVKIVSKAVRQNMGMTVDPLEDSSSKLTKQNLEIADGPQDETDSSDITQTYEIQIENVSFFRGDHRILADISLAIPQGSVVAIVGASGCGKTTLLQLIAGLLEPSVGSIAFPHLLPEEESIPAPLRREHVSLVTQEPILFPWSISKNILAGLTDTNNRFHQNQQEETLQRSLSLSGSSAFAADAVEGLETVLQEEGHGLSGGQSQRLTIARALMKNAPILLLDEPTSALDQVAEDSITALIASMRGETTIVMAAHRLSTVQASDTIVLMAEGRILAMGPHTILLESMPDYKRLCAAFDSGDLIQAI